MTARRDLSDALTRVPADLERSAALGWALRRRNRGTARRDLADLINRIPQGLGPRAANRWLRHRLNQADETLPGSARRWHDNARQARATTQRRSRNKAARASRAKNRT